ncbi:UNVERIFIED_CONTAM: hypothetical protein ABID98_005782 [Brevibacillus sp. OAP136]
MSGYSNSIVTFFDILGFAKLVETTKDASAIEKILTILKEESAADDKLADMYEMNSINFSDTIVRTKNIQSEANIKYRPGILFHELLDILHIQAKLIQHGILLRGSITMGEIVVRNGLIFGPALNRAYKLESEIAIHPRIIVDPALLQYFDQDPKWFTASQHDPTMEKEYLKGLLNKGSDGIWFIDYLRSIESEIDSIEGYISFLEDHKKIVISKAANLSDLNNVSAKYTWLASYHNEVINGLTEGLEKIGYEKADLIIEPQHIGPMYDF